MEQKNADQGSLSDEVNQKKDDLKVERLKAQEYHKVQRCQQYSSPEDCALNDTMQADSKDHPQRMNYADNMAQENGWNNPRQINNPYNMAQGNGWNNPRQINNPYNMAQGNGWNSSQQINNPYNMAQGNGWNNAQQMNNPYNMAQGNGWNNAQQMNNPNNMAQGNSQYNIPQETWQYNPQFISHNQNNENQNGGQFPEQYDNIDTYEAGKIIRNSGLALFFMALAVLISGSVFSILVNRFCPEIVDTNWYVWASTAFAIIGVGFPVFLLIARKIPNSPKGPVIKLGASRFIALFFICMSAMYITNIFSVIFTFMIASLKGDTELFNPAAEAIMNSNYVIALIYASFIAPVMEEITFRKILLDKLRRFGDIPAILMTGVAFGLFHMNLSQFFYATVLGFIFAYITIRTNTIKYSIILHMMVNFISTAITPIVTKKNIADLLMIWVFGSMILGGVFFVLNFKKIRLGKTVPQIRKSTYILNAGIILYILLCFIMIIYATIV